MSVFVINKYVHQITYGINPSVNVFASFKNVKIMKYGLGKSASVNLVNSKNVKIITFGIKNLVNANVNSKDAKMVGFGILMNANVNVNKKYVDRD